MNSNNITTNFLNGNRVSFDMPRGGYSLDDLSILEVAIRHAKRNLTDSSPEPAAAAGLDDAFARQCERQAAPT